MSRSINLAMAVALSLAAGFVVLNLWHDETAAYDQAHMTNIEKNQIWPTRTVPVMDPCALIACLEV